MPDQPDDNVLTSAPPPRLPPAPIPPPNPQRVVEAFDDLIRAELATTVRGRHRKIVKLAKLVEVLNNIYATRVADGLHAGDDPANWGVDERAEGDEQPLRGGGMMQMANAGGLGMIGGFNRQQGDAADLVRQVTSVIQDQTDARRSRDDNPLRRLERLLDVRAGLAEAGHDTGVIDQQIREQQARLAANTAATALAVADQAIADAKAALEPPPPGGPQPVIELEVDPAHVRVCDHHAVHEGAEPR